jgi:poly(A) polymerase
MTQASLHFDALPALLNRAEVKILMQLLNDASEETRLVGGAVRNALMGHEISDIDLATTAHADEVIARCTHAGLRTIATGYAHGTVTVLINALAFEVTTLREDVRTDGRHADVVFGRSFAHDAHRRDLTINALSLDRYGEVHDYADGLKDLAERRVRFIGTARQRICEDYLRSLRFFRFHAAYAKGPMDQQALEAIIAERDGLRSLSKERICSEMLKLLRSKGAAGVLEVMSTQGISSILLRPPTHPHAFTSAVALSTHITSPASKDMFLLAAYAARIIDDAALLRHDLRLSNAQTQSLEKMLAVRAALASKNAMPDHDMLTVLLYRFGREATQCGLLLSQIDHAQPLDEPHWRLAYEHVTHMDAPHFPFSGADLIQRGFSHGPSIGEKLKQLEEQWIAAGLPSAPDAIAALLDHIAPPH